MEILATPSDVNWLAVLVASIVVFALGAVWYAPPVLGKTWLRLTGIDPDAPGPSVAAVMSAGFATTAISVSALALFLGPSAGVASGLAAGLVAGVGISSMTVVLNGLYEGRSATLMAINAGYQIVIFTVAGLILGAW